MAMESVVNWVSSCRPRPTVSRAATLAAAEGEGYAGEDRISGLPDDLLYKVISWLPITDAARTTTLSTRWRNIWRSAPLVLFDEHIDPGPRHVAAINSVLVSHRGPFRTVHLASCSFNNNEPESELARWPRILVDRDVQDLVLFNRLPTFITQPLPAAILRCAKLCRLYLGFWEFPNTTDLHNFKELGELAILGVLMADHDLDHMLASSPALEKLALVASYSLRPQHVRLIGQKLKCVIVFYMFTAVEIAVVVAPCLERLIMWKFFPYSEIDESEDSHVGIRIVEGARVPALKVLGYLDTGFHQLRFGGDSDTTIIKVQANTKASPICRVPSVKILAIKVNLNASAEVQMLPSFLRCFPGIEVLHIESAVSDESSENHNPEFFEELNPIECVQLHIMKGFLYKFQGQQSEMAFLKYLALRANQMQKLTLVLPYEMLDSDGENNINVLLGDLLNPEWASEACTVLLLRPAAELICSFTGHLIFLSRTPFSWDGQELFSAMKRRKQDVN